MKIPPFFLTFLFFLSSYSIKAQEENRTLSVSEEITDGIAANSQETITRVVKDIFVDVQVAPIDGHIVIAEPIIISLSQDTLLLRVGSTKWPNEYPGDMFGIGTEPASFHSYFKVSDPDAMAPILAYQEHLMGKPLITTWIPRALGSVMLEFYGDLVIREGTIFPLHKEKVEHVIVQVPVTVVE